MLTAAQRLGRLGEDAAARALQAGGYRVLRRNFRAPHGGEVDLVCRERPSGTLVFIEVKTRRTRAFADPAAAVDATKRRLIAKGAIAWLRMLDRDDVVFRFDIVEVIVAGDHADVTHLPDAFALPTPWTW